MARLPLSLVVPCSLLLAALAGTAAAQAPERSALEHAHEAPPAGSAAAQAGNTGPAQLRTPTDPREDPARRYLFLGAGWRFVRVPSWLLKAYHAEAGPSIGTPASIFGEFAFRRDGFQVLANVGFVKWNFAGPFQWKGHPIDDTEWIAARLNFLVLSSAITWSTSFSDWFQLEYGLEAGMAFVFGDATRSEAVKQANGKWAKCDTWASDSPNPSDILYNPRLPNPTPEQKRYCDIPVGPADAPPPATNGPNESGAHYGVKARHGILHGGGVPRAVPLLGPRLSLRFKPIHQLVLRVDVPLPMVPFGFMGGISAQYGF